MTESKLVIYLEENMHHFVVNIVPADGLAPCGDSTSASALTKYGPYTYDTGT